MKISKKGKGVLGFMLLLTLIVVTILFSLYFVNKNNSDNEAEASRKIDLKISIPKTQYNIGENIPINIVTDLNSEGMKYELFYIEKNSVQNKANVCEWPGKWKFIKISNKITSKGDIYNWKPTEEGDFFIVANIRDDNNNPICTGIDEKLMLNGCGFNYPSCQRASVEVSIRKNENNLPNEKITMDAYSSHPNFWEVGSNQWVAKRYNAINNLNLKYDNMWWWSGPLYGNTDKTLREIIFQYYNNNIAGEYWEWEQWRTENKGGEENAIVDQFGGNDKISSKYFYSSIQNCIDNIPGVQWPNFDDSNYSKVDVVGRKGDKCLSGGYIEVIVDEVISNYSNPDRNLSCEKFFPSSNFNIANNICKKSPNVAVIYQRYVSPVDENKYAKGCEGTIYSWGNEYTSDDDYKKWFRNGEIRYSNYNSKGIDSIVPKYNDSLYWDTVCTGTWDSKTNWIYTGEYKLNNTVLIDDGE